VYEWRKMTPRHRAEIFDLRRQHQSPWHSPPHYSEEGFHYYHLTGACYEHRPIIGSSPERMAGFETELCEMLGEGRNRLGAWCVLPNHWHALAWVVDLKETVSAIGKFHGRTSFLWNQEDETRGRKCWHRCADRRIRSDRHFHVARNYIHHNPVKHGCVEKWEDWPYSSAGNHIAKAGREAVLKQWHEYPILNMGEGWDD